MIVIFVFTVLLVLQNILCIAFIRSNASDVNAQSFGHITGAYKRRFKEGRSMMADVLAFIHDLSMRGLVFIPFVGYMRAPFIVIGIVADRLYQYFLGCFLILSAIISFQTHDYIYFIIAIFLSGLYIEVRRGSMDAVSEYGYIVISRSLFKTFYPVRFVEVDSTVVRSDSPDRSNYDFSHFKRVSLHDSLFHPLYYVIRMSETFLRKSRIGGITRFRYMSFLDEGRRSNGMMTYFTYQNLIPDKDTIRVRNPKTAYQLRQRSIVPGMRDNTLNMIHRTHLIHHRISNMEGGNGVLVPALSSVNNGYQDITGARLNHLNPNSLLYHEQFVMNYVSRYKRRPVVMMVVPSYASKLHVYPEGFHIHIMCMKYGAIHTLRRAYVKNGLTDEERKKYKIMVDYRNGRVYMKDTFGFEDVS